MPEFDSTLQYAAEPGLDAILMCSNALVFIALCYKLSRLFKHGVSKLILHLSVNINRYYYISWVLFMCTEMTTVYAIGTRSENILFPIIGFILTLIFCYFIIEWYKSHLELKINSMTPKTRNLCYIMIWSASIIAVAVMYPYIVEPSNWWNDYMRGLLH